MIVWEWAEEERWDSRVQESEKCLLRAAGQSLCSELSDSERLFG